MKLTAIFIALSCSLAVSTTVADAKESTYIYGILGNTTELTQRESTFCLADPLLQAAGSIVFEKLKNIPEISLLEVPKALSPHVHKCLDSIVRVLATRHYHIESMNDPGAIKQWHIHNRKGIDAQILAGYAYLASQGQSELFRQNVATVAVIDTGIALEHPDLVNRIKRNMSEIPDNGIDDDKNGYIDDVAGWNFADNNSIAQDDHGHGTHVSGIIAAESGNGLGIAGIANAAAILPIRAFDRSGDASTANLVKAIDYAIGSSARIINASWGQYEEDSLLQVAVRAAIDHGILFVGASGNNGTDTDETPHFPSSYPDVLAVGAIDAKGKPAGFSNFGMKSVQVFAPGNDIYSTTLGGEYATMSGTSMAAPVVSGIAAVVMAQFPQENANSIRKLIIDGAAKIERQIPSLKGKCESEGAVSLLTALGGDPLQKYDTTPPYAVSHLVGESRGHFVAEGHWSGAEDNLGFVDYYLILRDGVEIGRSEFAGFVDESTLASTTYKYEIASVDWAGNTSEFMVMAITTPAFGASGFWSAIPLNIETPHPYLQNSRLSFDVQAPNSLAVDKLKIRFSAFNTEDTFDVVRISDSSGIEIGNYSGERGQFLSDEIFGDSAKITFESDRRISKYGFIADRIEVHVK